MLIQFITRDGQELIETLDRDLLVDRMPFFKDLLLVEDEDPKQAKTEEPLPPTVIHLLNVDGATLTNVLEFFRHEIEHGYTKIESPICGEPLPVDDWTLQFITDVPPQKKLIGLVNAWLYLEYKNLGNLCTAHMAQMGLDQSLEEFEKTWGVKLDEKVVEEYRNGKMCEFLEDELRAEEYAKMV